MLILDSGKCYSRTLQSTITSLSDVIACERHSYVCGNSFIKTCGHACYYNHLYNRVQCCRCIGMEPVDRCSICLRG